ncbi:MAG: FAD-dependent oxidoreductase, partial [Hyphomicrobiales bacterium]|nr:FAD-dependent oxidoreductase [Hyphomicrobiales bacterium]
LLDSYEAERIGFARRLVATTDRVFSFATADGRIADILRTRIAPALIPKLLRLEWAREFLFRTVSQITLSYRGSPLSSGAASHVHGGDRLPWVPFDGDDNFAPLASMKWQVHVYGTASAELARWCSENAMPLHAFESRDEVEAAGLAQDALYLIRPDCYVALADTSQSPEALERYFAERRLRLAGA